MMRALCRLGFQVRDFVLRMAAQITGNRTLVADDAPSSHVSYPFEPIS